MEDLLKPREAPPNLKPEPPVEIGSAMMKKNKEATEKLARKLEEKDSHYLKTLAGIAIQVFTLNKSIERESQNLLDLGKKPFLDELKIIRRSVNRLLEAEGLNTLDLTGRALDDSLAESTEILGWLYDPREEDYVLETYEPMIKHGDRVIHPAKVICGSKTADNGPPSE